MQNQSEILKKLAATQGCSQNTTIEARLTGLNRRAARILENSLALMFPIRFDIGVKTPEALLNELSQEMKELSSLFPEGSAESGLVEELPAIKQKLTEDAEAIFAGDPAAKSCEEVTLCYPGFFAIAAYRISHYLHSAGMPLLARCISELAHRETGIDIHPGARIGRRFCIDHGTGIVIGETTIIGDDVKLYHGVTLGGLSVKKELASQKRHPTIEDEVVIYSNAVILGGNTVIGKGTIIGGNVWLTHSIEAGCIVDQEKLDLSIRKRGQK